MCITLLFNVKTLFSCNSNVKCRLTHYVTFISVCMLCNVLIIVLLYAKLLAANFPVQSRTKLKVCVCLFANAFFFLRNCLVQFVVIFSMHKAGNFSMKKCLL